VVFVSAVAFATAVEVVVVESKPGATDVGGLVGVVPWGVTCAEVDVGPVSACVVVVSGAVFVTHASCVPVKVASPSSVRPSTTTVHSCECVDDHERKSENVSPKSVSSATAPSIVAVR